MDAIRLFVSYAFYMNFKFSDMDVKTTFLHGDMEHELFSRETPNFESEEFPDHVHILHKYVHSLNQAPKAWYERLSAYLLQNGYKKGVIDNTLFIKKS